MLGGRLDEGVHVSIVWKRVPWVEAESTFQSKQSEFHQVPDGFVEIPIFHPQHSLGAVNGDGIVLIGSLGVERNEAQPEPDRVFVAVPDGMVEVANVGEVRVCF